MRDRSDYGTSSERGTRATPPAGGRPPLRLRWFRHLILTGLALALSALAFPQDRGREQSWHNIDAWQQPQGLPQNSVYAVLQTRDGYLWMGTKGGISRFDGVRFTTFDDARQHELPDNEIWALAEGADSSLWIGSYGGGLTQFKDGLFTTYTARDGLAQDFVAELCIGREGEIWIGTDAGLSRFKDGRFTNYTTRDGLIHNTIRSLYLDRDQSLWIGTQGGGLHQLRDGKIYPQSI
ncbi:MAG TPA: two-component regulator propeller domain-containing protein, partial [Blastocatellia bacterium]|nr:two-component regulator propeller domain-containing protein [Blastocatellia bacterium]